MSAPPPGQRGWRLALKRCLDRAVAAVLLLAASPLLAAIALVLLVVSGPPVLFVQQRPGLGGRPFNLVKFRTMSAATDREGRPLPDADRLTTLGSLLRTLSLDELPQLWNVLRGELSFVGPRPLLMRYLDRYSPTQARRQEVLPGITGWAQVNGRNAITWERRLALDVFYVDHWSLGFDLRILALTVTSVITRRGIRREGHATMPEFNGGPEDER